MRKHLSHHPSKTPGFQFHGAVNLPLGVPLQMQDKSFVSAFV